MPTYIDVMCIWIDGGDGWAPGFMESIAITDGGFEKSFDLEDLYAQGCDPEF